MKTTKRNIPKLRFPEFENGHSTHEYKKYSFADIFNFSTGKNIKQSEASPEFETPCVRYGELYHMYSEVISEIVNRTNLDRTELLFSDGDEILLPSAGEDPLDIGSSSALTLKGVAIGRTINILKPKLKSLYSQVFVSYYINQRLKRKISSLAKGVSISNVYNSDLRTLQINLPTLPEQQKIAEFLTAVDKRIRLLEEKKQHLETYKQGVMQKLFSQEVRFKNDNGNDFPDWEEKKLGEVGEINPSNTELPEKFIYLDLESVVDGRLVKEEEILKADAPSRAQRLLKFNDIIFQMVRPYQKNNYLFTKEKKNYVASTGYAQIRAAENVQFLYFVLHTESFVNKVIERCTGTSYPAINSSDLAKIKINLPSLAEQQKIANFLSSLDEKIGQLGVQIAQSQEFKKGLLQQMFV